MKQWVLAVIITLALGCAFASDIPAELVGKYEGEWVFRHIPYHRGFALELRKDGTGGYCVEGADLPGEGGMARCRPLSQITVTKTGLKIKIDRGGYWITANRIVDVTIIADTKKKKFYLEGPWGWDYIESPMKKVDH